MKPSHEFISVLLDSFSVAKGQDSALDASSGVDNLNNAREPDTIPMGDKEMKEDGGNQNIAHSANPDDLSEKGSAIPLGRPNKKTGNPSMILPMQRGKPTPVSILA